MAQDRNRHRIGHPFNLPPRWRWLFWPVIAFSGGGTAISLWMEEEAIAVVDCLPIAALPGLAAIIYWFNHCVFKATRPRPKDLTKPSIYPVLLDKKD